MNEEQEKKFFGLVCVCDMQQKEIDRLNNIIEELEILIELLYYKINLNDEQQELLDNILDNKELKENKDDNITN